MSKLSEIIDIKNGKIASKGGSKYPVFGGNGIIGYSDTFNFQNIIIIGRVGANCGSIHKFNGKCWVSDNALAGIPKNGNNDFNYYLLKSIDLNKTQIGSSQPLLTQSIIYNIDLKFPSDSGKQKKIASVLLALDNKIELNNRINAELEAMAKLVYAYWFVQFDFPDSDGKPYKSSGGKMVWNEELKREIPEGWEVKALKSVSSLISRGISPSYLDEGGVIVLNQKCVREQKINFEFARRHDDNRKDPSSRTIQKLDILVNSTGVGTLGRVGIVKWLLENIITVDSHVTIVRSDSKKVNPHFIGFSLLQKQSEIEGFALGSTGQVELSKAQLEEVKLIIPPKAIQDSFAKTYSDVLEKTSVNEKQNQQLSMLRDWLLPMLMNGQVRID